MEKNVENLIDKEFDSKPIYRDSNNNKYMKAKIRTYGDKINTFFHNNKTPKQNISYKRLPLIILESVIRTEEKKYFPQTFLEECKYEEKILK